MLWILTQDKKSLVNVKEIKCTENGKSIVGMVEKMSVGEWSEFLGVYESQERALEVINDIFKRIDANNRFSVTYTMPEK